MNGSVCYLSFPAPEFNRKEILRYAGVKGGACETFNGLLEECIEEAKDKFVYKVCYGEFKVSEKDGITDLSFAKVKSEDLRKNLNGCKAAVLFAATVGIEIDRLIAKHQTISPVKALTFQAIGAERIESLCDLFCTEIERIKKPLKTKPRFSPGYGDLPISLQKDIFGVLDCPKRLGLTLNESLLMSPSKSVTAIIGVACDGRSDCGVSRGCKACKLSACDFRSE